MCNGSILGSDTYINIILVDIKPCENILKGLALEI